MARRPRRRTKSKTEKLIPVGFSLISQALYKLAHDATTVRADDMKAEVMTTVVLSAMWLEAYANQLAPTTGFREEPPPAGVK